MEKQPIYSFPDLQFSGFCRKSSGSIRLLKRGPALSINTNVVRYDKSSHLYIQVWSAAEHLGNGQQGEREHFEKFGGCWIGEVKTLYEELYEQKLNCQRT